MRPPRRWSFFTGKDDVVRPTPGARFARQLRELRERLGMDQFVLAGCLDLPNVSYRLIIDLELELILPPSDYQFYCRLQRLEGVTAFDISQLLQSANYALLWVAVRYREHNSDLVRDIFLLEEMRETLTQSFTHFREHDIISPSMKPQEMEGGAQLPSPSTDPLPQSDPSPTPGTKLPERVLEQPSSESDQGLPAPKKGDIYQRRTRYDDAYLQEHIEPLSQRFNAALRNPDDPLNHAAKQGLHVFAETMAQTEGTSLNEAAREHNLPLGSLHNWVRQRLVPTLYKDSHAVYIPKEAALKAAAVYQKAKETGKQPARLLRGMFKK